MKVQVFWAFSSIFASLVTTWRMRMVRWCHCYQECSQSWRWVFCFLFSQMDHEVKAKCQHCNLNHYMHSFFSVQTCSTTFGFILLGCPMAILVNSLALSYWDASMNSYTVNILIFLQVALDMRAFIIILPWIYRSASGIIHRWNDSF